jgi:predicted DNA-binding antitoxin AbrB/MazE fold protein
MGQTIEAIYDGAVFRPTAPVKLKPNTRVRVTVSADEDKTVKTELPRLNAALKREKVDAVDPNRK